MSDITYTIKIKKNYASAIIEDLKQVDAIEIIEDPVPEWQKQESLKRLSEMKSDPSSVIQEEDFFKALDGDKE
jgi:L-alanine-DL-glutamate epimerase-like enolase superfamily enzyme